MRFTNVKWSTTVLAAIAALALLTPAPSESATLTFDQLDNAGTLSYDGLGGPLVGTDIKFETILGTDTPLNDGVLVDCTGCLLDFATGANIDDTGGTYEWAGGGTFTITGSSIALGIPAGSLIVSGSWSGSAATIVGDALGMTGFGFDIKDPRLTGFYGVGALFTYVDSNIVVTGVTTGPGTAFNASLGIDGGANFGNADFVNTEFVPLPGSLSLLLLGLSGVAAFTRRRT